MNEFIIINTPRAEALTPEEARRWENTVRTCENLLETDQYSLPTRHLLAQAHLNLNAPKSAAFSLSPLLDAKKISPEILVTLAEAFIRLGLFQEAKQVLDIALALVPESLEVLQSLIKLHQVQGNLHTAEEHLRRILELKPKQTILRCNYASYLTQQDRLSEADEQYQKAHSLDSEHPAPWFGLGVMHKRQGSYKKAENCFRKSSKFTPNRLNSLNNIGTTLIALGDVEQAKRCFREILDTDPDHFEAIANMAWAYGMAGNFDDALRELDILLKDRPDSSIIFQALLFSQKICDWNAVKTYREELDKATQTSLARGDCPVETPFAALSLHSNPERNRRLTNAWAKAAKNRIAYLHEGFDFTERKLNRRLRIGYLSVDFCNHPILQQTLTMYSSHDRRSFEILAYSCGKDDNSPHRIRLKADCDRFVDLYEMDTLSAAKKIHQDQIDILVDLSGHTKGNRMEICGLRPAPIQVVFLSATGTNGRDFYDYAIVDHLICPLNEAKYYNEKVVWLPETFFINHREDALCSMQFRRSDFGLPENSFVFGSFNDAYKLESEVFACWIRLLRSVPGSILWLGLENKTAKASLCEFATAHGVSSDRLVFAGKLPDKSKHLGRLQLMDLALDTLVYNGQTTTRDALWAGVPVITIHGSHIASRVSASILFAMGLNEGLVASDLNEYEALALHWARNPEGLRELRRQVWEARNTSSLFDTKHVLQQIESAYLEMARRWNSGLPPDQFRIDSGLNIVEA